MEIQQGRTMPEGKVNTSSLNWVKLPTLSLSRLDKQNSFYMLDFFLGTSQMLQNIFNF